MKTWTPEVARWIWLPGEERPANAYVQFRSSFKFCAVPRKAEIHVSADCRYLLSINGCILGRGPVITDPKYKQVDVHDVTSRLVAGENVVAALVLQRHNKTSRLYPNRGGFILQLDCDDVSLGTDDSWKARWAEEYKSDTPYMSHQYGQQEWCDGRKVPEGWQNTGFDDSGWQNAVTVVDSERFWPKALELRAVPHMLLQEMHPKALVSYFGLTTNGRPREDDPEPARAIMNAYPLSSVVAWNTGNIASPENGPALFREKEGDGVGIVVDLGEEMLGYPFIDIECPEGTVVDIGHGEILSRNRVQTVFMPEAPNELRFADRYITREGRQRFEIFDTKGCRYLEIHFNRLADFYTGAQVIVHKVGIVRSRPPFKEISDFRSSDERLNRIWDICCRTALVKCQDWNICDAQREQNNWPELFQFMLYRQCFGNVEMYRQTIHQFCRAQLPSGFFLCTFPTIDKQIDEITEKDIYVFSTFAVPMMVYIDWLYGGEDPRQGYWLECCAKAIDALLRCTGPQGTLVNLPGLQWLEWTGLDARDLGRGAEYQSEVTALNGFMIMVLEKTAELAVALGRADLATCWIEKAAALRESAGQRYWSSERGAYLDGIYDGERSGIVSQSTNAVAVLAGMGDDARLQRIMQTTEDPARCDVPSGLNMMALYHETLQSLGMHSLVIDRIRRKWGYMLDHGATTTWESEEALERGMGLCFGFGAHPLNYMARTLLGVTPVAPGYRRFSVRIVPHDLDEAEGTIATPHGAIEISWRLSRQTLTLNLEVPVGCEAVVASPLLSSGLQLHDVQVDGNSAELIQLDVAKCTFLREKTSAVCVGEGRHEIIFQP